MSYIVLLKVFECVYFIHTRNVGKLRPRISSVYLLNIPLLKMTIIVIIHCIKSIL